VWHAKNDVKPYDVLEESKPTGPERLDGIYLSGTSLDDVDWFDDCTLVDASFTDVDFRGASLLSADLQEASFDGVDLRDGDLEVANLENATFTNCDLRGASLQEAQFDQCIFENVRISRRTSFDPPVYYARELTTAADDQEYRELAQAAIWSYREIYSLNEDNALPYEARAFYLREKNMRRRLAWHEGNYSHALTAEGSRWVTGYGMSPWRVLGTATVVIIGSALLYPTVGGLRTTVNEGTRKSITWHIKDPSKASRFFLVFVLLRSLYFSVITFTTLGYGDIEPVGTAARTVAGIESLLGALLTALLVFVLSRRIR
jgi:hypothetical protein